MLCLHGLKGSTNPNLQPTNLESWRELCPVDMMQSIGGSTSHRVVLFQQVSALNGIRIKVVRKPALFSHIGSVTASTPKIWRCA